MRSPLPGVEKAHLGERAAAQQAGAVGGAVEGIVMDDDQFASEAMDVDLDAIGAHFERAPDGAEGVFRFMPAGAAVTYAEQMVWLRPGQLIVSAFRNGIEPAQAGKCVRRPTRAGRLRARLRRGRGLWGAIERSRRSRRR